MATINKIFGFISSKNGICKSSFISKAFYVVNFFNFKLKLLEFNVCLLLALFNVQHQFGLSCFILFKLVKLFFLYVNLILQSLLIDLWLNLLIIQRL